MTRPYRFRPVFGRILAVAVILLCVVLAGQALVVDAAGSWLSLAPLSFVAVGAWALFWQPAVDVTGDAVVVRNILRTVRVPWSRIVNVDTRYALTLELDSGRKVGAWASPAPGALQALRLDKRRLATLPTSTYVDGTVRPGDDESTDSGLPALVIRREWERRAEEPDSGETVETTWHVPTAIALAVLFVATVAAILVSRMG